MKNSVKIIIAFVVTFIALMIITTSVHAEGKPTNKGQKSFFKTCKSKGYKPSPQRNKTFKGGKSRPSATAKKMVLSPYNPLNQGNLSESFKTVPTASGFDFQYLS